MRALRFLAAAFAVSVATPTIVLSQAGPSVFLGTEVSPLGAATLSVGAAQTASRPFAPLGSRLYVGNLGFSGDDGFRMHIGGGSGAIVRSNDLTATLPVGGQIVFRVSNGLGINPCCIVGRTGAVMFETTPDFGPIGDYMITIFSAGVPVAQYSGMSGPMATSTAPVEFSADLLSVITPLPDPFTLPAVEPYPTSEGFRMRWNGDVIITNAMGQDLGTGDEVWFFPESAPPLGSVDHVDVTVMIPAGLPVATLGIDDLAQQMNGHTVRNRKNGAIIAADLGKAKVTLSAGIPGTMQVDTDESEIEECLIWDIKDGCAAGGDTDEFSVTGDLIAGGQGEVGKVTATCDGTQWSVVPDFSGSGSPDASVELLDESGNVLGINPSTLGPITVMTDMWANETGVEDNNNLALVLGFPSPVPVNLPGVGTLTASKIKMHSNASKKYRFFVIVDRTSLSTLGNEFVVDRSPNTFRMDLPLGMAEFTCRGTLTGKRVHQPVRMHSTGPGLSDGAAIAPCVMPGDMPPDQFGVRWAPLGPPSIQTGETDWAFVSRLAADPEPVSRLALHLASDGSVVGVYKNPGPSQTPEVQVILKKAGQVMAEYSQTDFGMPLVELSDWPIGIGYQLLGGSNEPWSMWIDLGYEMDVTTPGAASVATKRGAAFPLTKADLIEVIAKATPNPGPPQETMLSASFMDIPYIVFTGDSPEPVSVGPAPHAAHVVLHPPYPNPFNPQTTLAFDLATGGNVSLKIYAVDGGYVATVHEGELPAGHHTYPWDGVNRRGQPVASGIYVAELRTPDGVRRTKLNLLK